MRVDELSRGRVANDGIANSSSLRKGCKKFCDSVADYERARARCVSLTADLPFFKANGEISAEVVCMYVCIIVCGCIWLIVTDSFSLEL